MSSLVPPRLVKSLVLHQFVKSALIGYNYWISIDPRLAVKLVLDELQSRDIQEDN
jgi:hypothetical protein